MSVVAALEAALAESPDHPLLYAAYADALADAGDPRGEFVRLQAVLDDPVGGVDRKAAERELRRLWLRSVALWVTPRDRVHFRVGFYHLDGDVPLARLIGLPRISADRLAASPVWWLLRGVRIDGLGAGAHLTPADLRTFFATLCRSRVRTLSVHQAGAGDRLVAALIDSGLYVRLTALSLPDCDLSAAGAERLAAHPHSSALRLLEVGPV